MSKSFMIKFLDVSSWWRLGPTGVATALLVALIAFHAYAQETSDTDDSNSAATEVPDGGAESEDGPENEEAATQESAASGEPEIPVPTMGPSTNLPLPRFVSFKSSEGYARRGPSRSHRIDWIFTVKGTPLEVTAEFGHWRRIHAFDGSGGWMHYALLSGVRTVVFTAEETRMRVSPSHDAPIRAIAKRLVIGKLGKCNTDWCRVATKNYKGWVPKSSIWGVYDDEIRD